MDFDFDRLVVVCLAITAMVVTLSASSCTQHGFDTDRDTAESAIRAGLVQKQDAGTYGHHREKP